MGLDIFIYRAKREGLDKRQARMKEIENEEDSIYSLEREEFEKPEIQEKLKALQKEYEECDYPNINTLINQGKLIECHYSEEYRVSTNKFPCRCPYNKVLKEFKKNGFNVTRKAIKHNYEAWSVDCKSGYRDEENNYFLFTPCGHNPLSFTAIRLDEHLDWQETYGAENMW